SFKFLIEAEGHLAGVRYPLPSLEMFNALDDKGSFANLCERLRLQHPPTVMAPKAKLLEIPRQWKRPIVIKPTRSEGGRGVMHLRSPRQLAKVDYGPVLAQEYIVGKDLCICMVCDRGQIVASIAYRYERGVYHIFQHPNLHRLAQVIIAAT